MCRTTLSACDSGAGPNSWNRSPRCSRRRCSEGRGHPHPGEAAGAHRGFEPDRQAAIRHSRCAYPACAPGPNCAASSREFCESSLAWAAIWQWTPRPVLTRLLHACTALLGRAVEKSLNSAAPQRPRLPISPLAAVRAKTPCGTTVADDERGLPSACCTPCRPVENQGQIRPPGSALSNRSPRPRRRCTVYAETHPQGGKGRGDIAHRKSGTYR